MNTYLVEVIKSQGLAVGGVVVMFIILVKFISKVMEASREREIALQNIITNHLHDHSNNLALISQNLKESTDEHSKMIELLIKINERVKK